MTPALLDAVMNRGWPALETSTVGGWLVRRSGGVTRRANSVLPVAAPRDVAVALERVESAYRDAGLVPTFQVSPAAEPRDLDEILAARGYELRSPTLVQVTDIPVALARLPEPGVDVTVTEEPDDGWLDLWWSVDGRGGTREAAVARRILVAGPALYASIHDAAGVAAVGRMALVGEWGGVYCMAVRPDVRRRGCATAVLRALLDHASSHGVRHAWLQVLRDNLAARALYSGAGFTDASGYHYRCLRDPQGM